MLTINHPIFQEVTNAGNMFDDLLNSFSETAINEAPAAGSWTAAQVAVHVTKSNHSIVQALRAPGKPALRNIAEMTPKLEAIFLDFNSKLEAPGFIKPEIKGYEKASVMAEVKQSFQLVVQTGQAADLSQMIPFPGFGELTKLELLHFVKVHTLRHNHQLKKMPALL